MFSVSSQNITEEDICSAEFRKEPVFYVDEYFTPHLIMGVNVCNVNNNRYVTDFLLSEEKKEKWISLKTSPGYENHNFFDIEMSRPGYDYLKMKVD